LDFFTSESLFHLQKHCWREGDGHKVTICIKNTDLKVSNSEKNCYPSDNLSQGTIKYLGNFLGQSRTYFILD